MVGHFLQVHCSASSPKLTAEMLVPGLKEVLHVSACSSVEGGRPRVVDGILEPPRVGAIGGF